MKVANASERLVPCCAMMLTPEAINSPFLQCVCERDMIVCACGSMNK